jgi:Asp-tRNA(Asn)/Glu-tRNA(Gln) amidotransferase A subunit family amidase
MTKSVKGAAMMLTAMATGNDTDYAAGLDKDSLRGVRVGVLRYAEGKNSRIIQKFNEALKAIEAAGAIQTRNGVTSLLTSLNLNSKRVLMNTSLQHLTV